MIVTLTGASGAGKSTLAKAVIGSLPGAELSPGCTTRARRANESPYDVRHLSREGFSEIHSRGEFLWAVEVHGHLYGTLRSVIAAGLSNPEQYLLVALTPDVLPILDNFAVEQGKRDALRSIYVLSPEAGELRLRLAARGLDSDDVERRLADCLTWDAAARSSDLYDLMVPGQGNVEQNARRVVNFLRTK